MMRIWNPSHFDVGQTGRSNCPKWRGQDYSFEANETKEVPDLCGRWLISEFGYYGLVSLPDRNIIKDPSDYDAAVVKLREHGIQQLYKWAVRVIDQYREEAKKCVDARERPPRPNDFVKMASKMHKKYHGDIMLSDPRTIEEHNLMREILGTVEHDSDKMLERSLEKEIKDADDNARQYSNEPLVIMDDEPNLPGEPTRANPMSEERKTELLTQKTKRTRRTRKKVPKVESTMENMKVPINLDQNAL